MIALIMMINTRDRLTVQAGWIGDVVDWVSDTGEIIAKDINKAAEIVEQAFYATCNNIGVFAKDVFDTANQIGDTVAAKGILGNLLIAMNAYTQEQITAMSNEEITAAANSYILNGFKVVDGKVTIPDKFVDTAVSYVQKIIESNEYYYVKKTIAINDIQYINNYISYESPKAYENYCNLISTMTDESIYYMNAWGNYGTVGGINYFGDLTNVIRDNYIVDIDGAGTYAHRVVIYNKNWQSVTSDLYLNYYFHSGATGSVYKYVTTLNGTAIRIFYSLNKLKEWSLLKGKSNYYYTNNYINYDNSIDNSMTISKDTFTNNNWKEVNNNNYNTIDNHVENHYTENNTIISSENLESIILELVGIIKELIDKEPEPTPTIAPTPTLPPDSTPTIAPTPTTPLYQDNDDYGILDYIKKSPSLFKALADMVKSLFEFVGSLPSMFGTIFFFFPEPIKNMIGIGMLTCLVLGVIKWLRR